MAISLTRKLSAGALFFLLLAGVVVSFLPALAATNEVKGFCEGLTLGTSLNEVKSRAASREFEVTQLVDGRTVVEHPRSLGRIVCDLRFDGQGRLAAKNPDGP
jgi:hypothetical protein